MNRYPTTRHAPSEQSSTLFTLVYTPEMGHHVKSERVSNPHDTEQVLRAIIPPLKAGKAVGAPNKADKLSGVAMSGKSYIYWEAE